MNLEHKWIYKYDEDTVTVKYTDKIKFTEEIKKYMELYPEIEQMLKPSKCYIVYC